MAKLDLAFQLTANADGVAAGVSQADRELSKVGASAKATSAEFRQAAQITAEMRTPAEKYADTIGRLDQMLQKGLLTQEVYGRAVSKAKNEMDLATSSFDDMAKGATVAERVLNGVTGAIKVWQRRGVDIRTMEDFLGHPRPCRPSVVCRQCV